jgi:PKD domain
MTVILVGVSLLAYFGVYFSPVAHAQLPPGFIPLTTENPKTNAYGIEGTISSPPPSEGARIVAPSGGQTYNFPVITVSGTCPSGLLVEILDNDVMVGATYCENSSFSLEISLFVGRNDIKARVRDDLGQLGPSLNTVTVTYNNPGAQFSPFTSVITLTSPYSRRAIDPGSTLIWPIQLSGGSGPYAFSIDWGDGTEPDLQSEKAAGNIEIKHAYSTAGIYRVTIRVTDSLGVTGFLQVIAIANGEATSSIVTTSEPADRIIMKNRIIWIPAAIVTAMLIPAFWLGRRHEARSIMKRLERDAKLIRDLDA